MELLEPRRVLDSTVVFNEIMYHPTTNEPGLELHNQLSINLELTGWRLAGGIDYSFPPGTIIPGGGYLVVASDPAALAAHGDYSGALGPFTGRLDNDSDRLSLRDNNDRQIDEMRYEHDGAWAVGPDGGGVSLAKIDEDTASDVGANWRASGFMGGTPGAANDSARQSLIVPVDATWRYNDTGVDLGTAWRDPAYVDSGWAGGAALLYFEDAALPAPKNTPLAPGHNTYYFRKSFTFSGNPATASLVLDPIVDDGAVIYLNGVEVQRLNMPDGPVGYNTFAQNSVGNASFAGPITVSGANLVVGTNVLAVEVHQANETVGSSDTLAYYRFEETSGVDVFDTVSGADQGDLIGTVTRTTNVFAATVPQTGAANSRALDFTTGGYAKFTGTAQRFIFNTNSGASGDATLEWFMRTPGAPHSAIFWTNGDNNADSNRYNIFWNASFTGAPNSDRFIDADFREPNGAVHNIGAPGYNSGNPLSLGAWHHVAIVRHDDTPGNSSDSAFTWNWYIDGVLSEAHTATTNSPLPNAASWLLAGRQGGHAVNALIDEVRFTRGALSPSQFLNAVGGGGGPGGGDVVFGTTVAAAFAPVTPPTLAFNEIASAADASFRLELINDGTSAVALGGIVVASSIGMGSEAILPAQMLPAGSRKVLTQADVGIADATAGDKLFLFTPGRTALIDAVVVKDALRGRSPEGTGPWLFPDVATFGAANHFALHDEIVINEIMYHHRGVDATPPVTQTQTAVNITDAWQYDDSGADLGTAWRGAGYDDSGWATGNGLFYVEEAALPAPKNTPLATGRTTYYFRKHFNYAGNLAGATLALRPVVDDGAVYYLNGVEVYRTNMPAGPVAYGTLATVAVGNATIGSPIDLPADHLLAGDNVLAVEVHQAATGDDNPTYYRFEDAGVGSGVGHDVIDDVTGLVHGQMQGAAGLSTDVPSPAVPQTGAANTHSYWSHALGAGPGSALMNGDGNGLPFLFNNPSGDATLEWYLKVPVDQGHNSIFWTDVDDAHGIGFNIFWNSAFTGAPNSERFIAGGLEADLQIIGTYDNGNPLTVNEWHHVAIVRTDLGNGDLQWRWFIDGVHSPGHDQTTSNAVWPDFTDWTISGRPGQSFDVLLDEIRMSNEALTPARFLNAAPSGPAPALYAYYRFEDAGAGSGEGVDVIDAISGNVHGTFLGSAGLSTDVPSPTVPQTGAANTHSYWSQAHGGAPGSLLMNGQGQGVPFLFNDPVGDATLEWYLKVPVPQGHSSIFWTDVDDVHGIGFNIFWNASFTGAPDSDRFIAGGLEADLQIIGTYNNGNPLSLDEWHHVAIVRTDLGGGQLQWRWFIDGVYSPGHDQTTINAVWPNFASWTITGRPGLQLNVLLDEVRMTHRALAPDEFLNAPPSGGGGNPPDVVFGAELSVTALVAPGQPAHDSPEEWIELYNRSNHAVDLTGWRMDEGIDYDFPAATTIGPGGYLVVAKDKAALQAIYPTIAIVGDYSGALADSGERVVLRDPLGNPADEVRYFTDTPWPSYADGSGASLELRDPDADNSRAAAWAASDEGAPAQWHTYTYRGVAGPDHSGTTYQEFVLGLLDAGEVLLDNIRVVQDPDTNPVQLLQQGDFESGSASAWRILGNHTGSVIPDPGNPFNLVLRLVSTGQTDDRINHAETTLKDGGAYVSIVPGREYEITFDAKWIGGTNKLSTRLYFNRVAQTTALAVPEHNGTPGAVNSRFEGNLGPTYHDLRPDVVVPDAGQAVTISVVANDPDGVSSLTLYYVVDSGPFNFINMADQGAGPFAATIPGQAGAAVVQFYVEGFDNLGASSFFPAAGPDSRALYQVDDGRAAPGALHNFRIILTPADAAAMHAAINIMSNGRLGGTVLYDESTVYYDVGVRLNGAPSSRPGSGAGYNVRFHADELFRGIQQTVIVDRNKPNEILALTLNHHAGDIPAMYNDLTYFIAPVSGRTGISQMRLAGFGQQYLAEQYANGDEGLAYEKELIYVPSATTGGPEGYKLFTPYEHPVQLNTDIADYGTDPDAYRFHWLKENHRDQDDFARIIEMNQAFGLVGAALDAATRQLIDVDQWLRSMAMVRIIGNRDFYTQPGGPPGSWNHNFVAYVRPADGKVLLLPYDIDESYQEPISGSLIGSQNFAKVELLPGNLRRYYCEYYDLLTGAYSDAYLSYWVNYFTGLAPGIDFNGPRQYLLNRGNYILSQLPAEIPFAITTNGGADFSTDQSSVVLQGKAWYRIAELFLQGRSAPLDVTWLDTETWQVTVPLATGANVLTVEGYDCSGALLSSDTITVTTSFVTPSQDNLRVTEIQYHPADPTTAELAIDPTFQDDDFEYLEIQNIGAAPIDLTGVRIANDVAFSFGGSAVTTLGPGEYVLVVESLAGFAARYNVAGLHVAGEFSGNLSNTGGTLELIDAVGRTIQLFTYDDDGLRWHPETDGLGPSLVIIDPLADRATWNDGASWRPSSLPFGSPGVAENLLVVTNTSDSGPSSLRQAMLNANAAATTPTIEFEIPGGGPHVIQLSSPLPNLTQATRLNLDAGEAVEVGTFNSFTFGQFASLTKLGAGTLTVGGAQSHSSPAQLIASAGTLVMASDGGTNLTIIDDAHVVLAASQHLAGLQVGNAALARLNAGGGRVLLLSSLSIQPTGTLDLTDNDLIMHATPATRNAVLASVSGLLASGAAALAWNGPGINSSVAAADATFLTALGVPLNDDGFGGAFYPVFAGQAVDANSILVKYTYFGDADLSGSVDGTDYALIDNGFNAALTGWFNGDFDFTTAVDGTDYALIDNAFNSQGGPLAGSEPAGLGPIPRAASPDTVDGDDGSALVAQSLAVGGVTSANLDLAFLEADLLDCLVAGSKRRRR